MHCKQQHFIVVRYTEFVGADKYTAPVKALVNGDVITTMLDRLMSQDVTDNTIICICNAFLTLMGEGIH